MATVWKLDERKDEGEVEELWNDVEGVENVIKGYGGQAGSSGEKEGRGHTFVV